MDTNVPFIGKKYRVISGPYIGFEGVCVSYQLEHTYPIIIQDDNWNSKAVRVTEVEPLENNENELDINRLQRN